MIPGGRYEAIECASNLMSPRIHIDRCFHPMTRQGTQLHEHYLARSKYPFEIGVVGTCYDHIRVKRLLDSAKTVDNYPIVAATSQTNVAAIGYAIKIMGGE